MRIKVDAPVGSSPVRAAILQAFRDLIQTTRYDRITVKSIVGRAHVARSSFYEHFRTKEMVLLESLAEPLGELARSVRPNCDVAALRDVLQHFWDNRRIANAFLSGPMRRPAGQLLSRLVEDELSTALAGRHLRLPTRLAAQCIAGGQLALVHAWISGEAPASAAELAPALAALGCNAAASATIGTTVRPGISARRPDRRR